VQHWWKVSSAEKGEDMALRSYGSTVWHILRSKRGEAHTAEQIAFQPRGALTATDIQAAMEQLMNIVTMAGPLGGTTSAYRHIQAIPAATWTVNHMLGFKANIQLFDDAGREIDGAVHHVDQNVMTVSFIRNVAGEAYCS
jgi:hypothetical protein